MRCFKVATAMAWLIAIAEVDAAEQPSVEAAWQDASRLLISDAHASFKALRKEGKGDSREVRFGEAVTLLNVQPKTPGNIEAAAVALAELARENPDDEYGILAKYYLGRIEQIHRYEPDWDRAAQIYKELLERHPGHPIAQIGAVKYGIVQLYGEVPMEEIERRTPEIESLAAKLTFPPAKRDLHLMLADVYTVVVPSKEKALEHLLAAERVGIARRKVEGDIWLRIGALALALDRKDLAAEYYRKFTRHFARNDRAYTASQRLLEIEGGAAQ